MTHAPYPPLLAGLVCLGLTGCGLGKSDTLFFTVTNYGVNIDTKPPTVEISLARREGVIQPEFEGGLHLPVAASFTGNAGLTSTAKIGAASVFAGGAAAHLVALPDQPTNPPTDALDIKLGRVCVSQPPVKNLFGNPEALPSNGEVRRFVMGTDSSLGLTVGWSGLTAAMPDSLRFGYARKEMALASAFLVKGGCEPGVPGYRESDTPAYAVGMPSFLATINGQGVSGGTLQTSFAVGQTFATGSAARLLASDGELRKSFRDALIAGAKASAAISKGNAEAAKEAAEKN